MWHVPACNVSLTQLVSPSVALLAKLVDDMQVLTCYNVKLKNVMNKLGLSWAKLSCQLGSGCTVINICCLIFMNKK